MTKKGAIVAAAVAGLFVAAAPIVSHAGAKVKCSGINKCKGKGGCAGADHECKGKNECKGKGWKMASEKACAKKGGTVVTDEAPAAAPEAPAPEAPTP